MTSGSPKGYPTTALREVRKVSVTPRTGGSFTRGNRYNLFTGPSARYTVMALTPGGFDVADFPEDRPPYRGPRRKAAAEPLRGGVCPGCGIERPTGRRCDGCWID